MMPMSSYDDEMTEELFLLLIESGMFHRPSLAYCDMLTTKERMSLAPNYLRSLPPLVREHVMQRLNTFEKLLKEKDQ